jgi:TetR/AcrR family fatty acid metabolism transcriptional regulator
LIRTKQQVVCEFRRAAILDAARSVLARRGFACGIMDEIAREAGIAKGTIYLYFRSKTDIYKAVFELDMKALMRRTMKRIDAAKSLQDKIRAFAFARLENADTQKEFFRIMDSEEENLAMTRAQYTEFLHEPVLRLASAIEEASKRGEIRPLDPEKTAWIIADMTRGIIQRRLLAQDNVPLREDAEFLLGFIWSSLAARPDPRPSESVVS